MKIFNSLLLMHNDKFDPHHYSHGTIIELHQVFVRYSCANQHSSIVVVIIPCLCTYLQGWLQFQFTNYSHDFLCIENDLHLELQKWEIKSIKDLEMYVVMLVHFSFYFLYLSFLHKCLCTHNLLVFLTSSRKELTCNDNKCNNFDLDFVSL
jgi:hypothetical protein